MLKGAVFCSTRQVNSKELEQPYRSRPARAQSLTEKALFDDLFIYPYFLTKAWVDPGNRFSEIFPSDIQLCVKNPTGWTFYAFYPHIVPERITPVDEKRTWILVSEILEQFRAEGRGSPWYGNQYLENINGLSNQPTEMILEVIITPGRLKFWSPFN